MRTPLRILLIAYNFPPLISPQSLRWFYLSKELSQRGYTIDVLTIKMPDKFHDLLDMIPKEISAYRTFPGPFYHLTFKYSREPSNSEEPGESANSFHFWKILCGIHFKIYKALNNLFIPDIYSEWIPFAIKAGLKLVKSSKYNIIISSSEQRVCHLVGYFLKKKSSIPWIADYGDPWIYPVPILSQLKFKKKIIERIERNILKRVDAITVAAEGIKKLYLERYPFLAGDKIHVITQGFDSDIFSKVEEKKTSKFRIVYCGSFYRTLRDPMPFFEAIEEIDNEDIELLIAGRVNEYVDILLERSFNRIKYLGFVDHKKSLSLQKGSTVLLNIGNTTGFQVPGKTYEYIGAKRPILFVKGVDRDLSAEIVIRYNKGVVVENKKGDIKDAILKLYGLWKEDLLDKNYNLNIVEDFTWQKKAEEIIKVIEKL